MTTAARLSATASTTPFARPSVTVACQSIAQGSARAVHLAATALLAAAAALAGSNALADGAKRYALDPTYVKECGDCHVAYPPALMQPEQWRQVMGRLDRHYGVDASLDSPVAASISAWLERNSGTKAKYVGAGNPPRISEGNWFRREHDEATASARRNAGSLARCDACHTDAARGDYSEDNIQLPRQLVGAKK